MDVAKLVHNAPFWLNGMEDAQGILVSCRVRLARNLVDRPFVAKATTTDQEHIVGQVQEAAQRSRALSQGHFCRMDILEKNERWLLVERRLASPALAEGKTRCGVLFEKDETLSVMINEEDHLRLQAILPGLNARQAWERVNALDDQLGGALEYAHSEKWGYLTACPTNTGTGLRVSVLMHLPALVLAEDMERIMRGLTQMAFTVRGMYGEGTNALGNLFQVSNQTTLGRSEEEIVEELVQLTRLLIEYERDAQETLLNEARSQVEDKIGRAFGILSHARVLSSQEFMNLLSAVRLGYSLSLIENVSPGFMNQLMIITQPSHLQALSGKVLEAEERDLQRADLVRQRIAEECSQSGDGPA
jgi:protein arginine kinase